MRRRPQWLVRLVPLAAGLLLQAIVLPPLAANAANPASPKPGAAAAGGGSAGGGARAEASDSGPVDPMDRILPEVNFQSVPFDDVIDFLRDVSGFQAVIIRSVIAALTLVSGSKAETRTFDDVQAALAWLTPRLDGEGAQRPTLDDVAAAWAALERAGSG